MLGNLALMRILVDEVHLPVLAANSVAILCCSLVNFGLGDAWVFAAGGKAVREQAAIRPL
jgi:putative flippase GtrA